MNVTDVVKDGLCHGCGACSSVCPEECIAMSMGSQGIYEPVPDMGRCTSCGLCMKVCSGVGVHYDNLALRIFGGKAQSRYLGRYRKLLLASSTRKELHDRASSGGVVTGILLHLLEKNSIQGSVVACSNDHEPSRVDSIIARDQEAVISAMGSKYYPTCTNILLREILRDDSGSRYAYVGLPCQIASLRKAEEIRPELKEKIFLRISLFCGRMVSTHGLDSILKRYGIGRQSISFLHYRYGTWPGSMVIKRNDSSRQIKFSEYYQYFMYDFFTPYRCLTCNDFHGDLADICCGDAWLDELKGSGIGKNLVIARTSSGADLLDEMSGSGLLSSSDVTEEAFVKTFGSRAYLRKKDSLLSRMDKYRKKGLAVPEIVDESLSFARDDKRDLVSYLHTRYLNTARFSSLCGRVPSIFIRIYYRFLSYLAE